MTELLLKLDKMSHEEQGVVALKTLSELADRDYYFFTKYIMGYGDLNRRTHKEPIQVCEAVASRKIVIEPRGTFKSTIVSVSYPTWRLKRNPNLTILLDSEVYTNSKNFLREIRQHMESNRLLGMVCGPWIGPVWSESEIIINQRTQNRKEASITVGGIETVKVGQHYDIIIGDDYNSPKNSDTPEKCRKVIDHVRYNLNILNPQRVSDDGLMVGEYLIAATRSAELDIPGFFLKDILGEKYLAEGKLQLVGNERHVDELIERALELEL